jgi:formiminotetrahydrofolate cyclodeaminase
MPLADQPLRQLLAAFSSSDPTPGGGSASALSAALGASLLMMVAALPKTRTGADTERRLLADAAAALGGIRARLTDAIDADAAAYDRVVAAYKLRSNRPTSRRRARGRPAGAARCDRCARST